MQVRIQYGKTGLDVHIPPAINVDVIEPAFEPAVPDPERAILDALEHPIERPPLRQSIRAGSNVGVVVNDITRATPYPVILPPLLREVQAASPARVTIFVATGTHRLNSAEELSVMLGDEAVRSYDIVQNDARDAQSHVSVGRTTSGNEVRVLRAFVECDVKILTGFIEPHFFAGFSGGGKAVMPGLAALDTIMRNHSVAHIDHPNATWGVTTGNPIWEEAREAGSLVRPDFLLNVTLNRDKAITHVFAGDYYKAHEEGCSAVKRQAMAPVDEPYDIVVTSNSGYPLDLNLYQSVKGMSAAAQVVRHGGHVVCAAECWDGVPDHGTFGRLLRETRGPERLLAMMREPGYEQQDMWQAQILALIRQRATVHFYTRGLTEKQVRDAMLIPCSSIESTLSRLADEIGPGIRACVLPEGPVTIPYVRS